MSVESNHTNTDAENLPQRPAQGVLQTGAAGIKNLVRAKGTFYFDGSDQAFFDAYSPSWIYLLGHSNPSVNKAIALQAKEMQGVWYPGSNHPAAEKLSKSLLAQFPGNHTQSFFSDGVDGSLTKAMELSVCAASSQGKTKLLVLSGMEKETISYLYSNAIANVSAGKGTARRMEPVFLSLPDAGPTGNFYRTFKNHLSKGDIAAFLYQPLLLSGRKWAMYDRALLDKMLLLCREYGTLAIADESYTGFGRTGDLFASQGQHYFPDIACLDPGAGSQLPLSMVTCTNAVYEAYLQNKEKYPALPEAPLPGNPIACAAAEAAFSQFAEIELLSGMKQVAAMQRGFVKKVQNHPAVKRIRSMGTFLMLELNNQHPQDNHSLSAHSIRNHFVEKGILLYSRDNLLLLSLPYVSSGRWVKKIHADIKDFLDTHRQINLF